MERAKRLLLGIAVGLLLVVATTAVGSCGLGSGALSGTEAKQLLTQLPYRYHWRQVGPPDGASDAVAGTVIGKHHTIVHFGIAFGPEPQAVPVPRAGTLTPSYYWGGGFTFNDDLEVPSRDETVHPGRQFHTAAQWDEATTMVVEMEEKLCKATTDEVCEM